MRYQYAISGLRHKRAHLAGEIEQIEREQAKRRAELAAIDATLRLFHPDADPDHITSIRPIWRGVYFKPGQRPRLCLQALRETGRPMNTGEIVEYVMRAKGMDRDDKKLRRLVKEHMRNVMNRLVARGSVRKLMSEPEAWWDLVDR
jgi:hypothetical protein